LVAFPGSFCITVTYAAETLWPGDAACASGFNARVPPSRTVASENRASGPLRETNEEFFILLLEGWIVG
jgi:hypothetical protein